MTLSTALLPTLSNEKELKICRNVNQCGSKINQLPVKMEPGAPSKV